MNCSSEDKCFVYVLSLENSKIYVGKTRSQVPEYRVLDHFGNEGSGWTRLHPPIKVLEIRSNCDDFEEDKCTKEYMYSHGIDNVRGGSYCRIELDEETKKHLLREMRHAKDVCIKCGRAGHFIRDCYAKTDVDGKPLGAVIEEKEEKQEGGFFGMVKNIIDSFIETSNFGSLEEENRKKEVTCYRCGRKGHISPKCYAKTHADGRKL